MAEMPRTGILSLELLYVCVCVAMREFVAATGQGHLQEFRLLSWCSSEGLGASGWFNDLPRKGNPGDPHPFISPRAQLKIALPQASFACGLEALNQMGLVQNLLLLQMRLECIQATGFNSFSLNWCVKHKSFYLLHDCGEERRCCL